MWKHLRHQNIVPFIGVTQDPLQFVSEWMPNGTPIEYLGKNSGVNRVDLVSFSLVTTALLVQFPSKLLDIAEGLAYLHAEHTKWRFERGRYPLSLLAASISINELLLAQHPHRRARLADFGFASVVRGLNSVLVSSVREFTPGCAALEVIRGKCVSTTEADVYAFGIVVIEVSPWHPWVMHRV